MPESTIRRMTMDDVDGVYAVEIGTFVDALSLIHISEPTRPY